MSSVRTFSSSSLEMRSRIAPRVSLSGNLTVASDDDAFGVADGSICACAELARALSKTNAKMLRILLNRRLAFVIQGSDSGYRRLMFEQALDDKTAEINWAHGILHVNTALAMVVACRRSLATAGHQVGFDQTADNAQTSRTPNAKRSPCQREARVRPSTRLIGFRSAQIGCN